MMSTMDPAAYDELSLFQENASEFGLPWPGPPSVRREDVALTGGGTLSALVWGPDVGPPELVFLHGTAMNAHTWDTVALALDRPLVAFDLPGHGHSSWRDDSTYSPDNLAEAVAQGVERLAPQADAVVGMSLGGMTAIVLAARWPELVRRLVLVDVTPGVNRRKAQAIIDFVDGPQTLPELRRHPGPDHRAQPDPQRVVAPAGHPPQRPPLAGRLVGLELRPAGAVATRRGEPADRRRGSAALTPLGRPGADRGAACSSCAAALSPVVDDADVAELLRRQPAAEVVVVDGAGHSVQGDRPLELAALIADFVSRT